MSISFNLQSLRLRIYLNLYIIGGSFLFRLPLVRRLPFQIKIFLYVVVKLLLLLVIYSCYRSLLVLLMDDLTRAVAPFLPGSGGINNEGFHSPLPGPSENSFFVAPASSDGLEREQGVIDTRSSSKNLQRDPSFIKDQLREKYLK